MRNIGLSAEGKILSSPRLPKLRRRTTGGQSVSFEISRTHVLPPVLRASYLIVRRRVPSSPVIVLGRLLINPLSLISIVRISFVLLRLPAPSGNLVSFPVRNVASLESFYDVLTRPVVNVVIVLSKLRPTIPILPLSKFRSVNVVLNDNRAVALWKTVMCPFPRLRSAPTFELGIMFRHRPILCVAVSSSWALRLPDSLTTVVRLLRQVRLIRLPVNVLPTIGLVFPKKSYRTPTFRLVKVPLKTRRLCKILATLLLSPRALVSRLGIVT